MRSLKFLIFTGVLITMIYSCKNDQTKSLEHYEKARQFFKQENFSAASKELDKAYILDSSNLEIQLMKAQILNEEEKYGHAIYILKSLITKGLNSDTVNFEIGRGYYLLGNKYAHENKTSFSIKMYNYGISYLNIAINKNDKYRDAYISKYKTLHNLKKNEDAILLLNSAIKIFPDCMEFICYKGIEKYKLGDFDGAWNDLNFVINSEIIDDSILAVAYRFRGILYSERGDKKAIDDLTLSLKYDSDNPMTFDNRARIYLAFGDIDKACADFRTAADLGLIKDYESIKKYCNK